MLVHMKALRSLEQNLYYLHLDELDGKDVEFLQKKLKDVDDQRIFAVAFICVPNFLEASTNLSNGHLGILHTT